MESQESRSQKSQQCNGSDHPNGPLPIDFQPDHLSVVIGRGRAFNEAAGNQNLKVLATYFVRRYKEAPSKQDKSDIVSRIVQMVEDACPDGGFVTLNGGRWWTVDEHTKRDGVARVLRDLLSDKYKSSSKSKVARRRVARDKKRAAANSSSPKTADRPTDTGTKDSESRLANGIASIPPAQCSSISPTPSAVAWNFGPVLHGQQPAYQGLSNSAGPSIYKNSNLVPLIQTPDALRAMLGGTLEMTQNPVLSTRFNRDEHCLPFLDRSSSTILPSIRHPPQSQQTHPHSGQVIACATRYHDPFSITEKESSPKQGDDHVVDLPEDLSTVFE